MKKVLVAIISVMIMSLGLVGLVSAPVMARSADEYGFEERDGNHSTPTSKSCAGVPTSVIDCESGDENGEAVNELLVTVVNVMMGLIGVLAVMGMIISGYQYMTASGDAAKVTKAKRRMIEIAIGLVAYALTWVALELLVPGL